MSNGSAIGSPSGAEGYSRPRVIGAITTFAIIFGFSVVTLTSVLPMPAATYLKHLLLLAMVIFITSANVYSEHFVDHGWFDKFIWMIMASGFSVIYMAAQGSVNPDLPAPQTYLSSYVLVTFALMLTLACIASIIVRKTILNSFKLWGAREPRL